MSAEINATFGNVLDKIDTKKTFLEKEQEIDLKKWGECKDILARGKLEMPSKEAAVDDLSASGESREQAVALAAGRVERHGAEINQIQKELEKSQELRDSERKEYLETKQNNGLALDMVAKAAKKISGFYQKDEASFLQAKSKSRQSLARGAIPSLDFGAPDTSQATVVVQTMEMVSDDIKTDSALADKEEALAQALFKKNKKSLEEQIVQLKAMKSTWKGHHSSAAQDLVVATAKECDSFLTNLDKRWKKRQDEIDGLIKSRDALLSG